MIKKTLSIFFIIIFLLPLNSKVFADSTTTSNKLKQVQETKNDLQNKVKALDKEINDVLKKIDSNKKDMNTLSQNISMSKLKLASEERHLKIQNDLMNTRLRAMYMSSGTSYLEVVINSKNIGDFLSRVDTISKLMQYDQKLIYNIEQQKLSTNKQTELLNNENNKLNSLKASNEATLTKMSKDINDQKTLLSKATDQEKTLTAQQKAEEAAAERARQIAVAASKTANSNNSGTSHPVSSPGTGAPPAGSYSAVLNLDATAYSGTGYTSLGTMTTRNPSGYSTIAVDPRVITPGTKVYVTGYGYASADDTGANIQGNIIDVYFPTDAEAQSWGRRSVQVYILK